MSALTSTEKEQIYELLTRTTAVFEQAQSRLADSPETEQAWRTLAGFIEAIDNIYHEVEDTD